MIRPSLNASIIILSALSLINLVLVVRRVNEFNSLRNIPTYSYVGNDFPDLLPLDKSLDLIDYTFTNNTVDYPIHGPGAEEIWNTMYPDGYGFVRLGPERRILCVSMFHQLHCVDKIRRALDDPDDPISTIPHLQHCLNYIRQMILCASDLTLEPVDIGHEASGIGVTHTCRNWRAVYDTVNRNYALWTEYWDSVQK